MNTTWIQKHRAESRAKTLEAQPEAIKTAVKAILEKLRDIENGLHWSIDPDSEASETKNDLATLLENAHELVDLVHAFRNARGTP